MQPEIYKKNKRFNFSAATLSALASSILRFLDSICNWRTPASFSGPYSGGQPDSSSPAIWFLREKAVFSHEPQLARFGAHFPNTA